MRDPERIDRYLDMVKDIWESNDISFFNMMLTCFPNSFDYYIEDDESLYIICKNFSNHKCNANVSNSKYMYINFLKELWHIYPDLRFTQLIFNCVNIPGYRNMNIDIDDSEFFIRLKKYYE